jgi:hypothetical protein
MGLPKYLKFQFATVYKNIELISIVQKGLHGLTKKSHTNQATLDRGGTVPGVTGGRALSFHGLSMGETPGPERMRGEQREGAKLPRR